MPSILNWNVHHARTRKARFAASLVRHKLEDGADSTIRIAHAPCLAGSGRLTIPFGVEGNARTKCRAGSNGQTVWFGANGTASTLCLEGSGKWTVLFRVVRTSCALCHAGFGRWMVRFGEVGTAHAWSSSWAVPSTPCRTFHLPEPTRHGVRAVPTSMNQTVRLPEPARH